MTDTTLDLITYDLDNLRGEAAPLYRIYPGQHQPQRAYIQLDEDGTVTADYSGEIGNGIPMSVWHNRTPRWYVNSAANGDSLAEWLESDEMRALLARVHAGHSVEWDGNNHVGRLDEDAEAARDEITAMLDGYNQPYDVMEVWDAYDWVREGFSLAELVEAGSVAACASAIEDAGCDNHQAVVGDMVDAVAKIAAEHINYHLDEETEPDDTVRAAAVILAAYSQSEYGSLVEAYDDEFGE